MARRLLPVVSIILTASCGMAMPTQPAAPSGQLAAPVITLPVCGAVSRWPAEPVALAWNRLDDASSYNVEIDCLGCGNYRDPWVSQSGTPWRLASGLRSPLHTIDVSSTVRREGGRAMRWRVSAVDRAGSEGAKSDWCVTVFSESGLPTPGARRP
jgi:hypothetical protein